MENKYFDGEIFDESKPTHPEWLTNDLKALKCRVSNGKIRVKTIDDCYIIILSLDISLPSRGTFNNIDIREEEEIAFCIEHDELKFKYNEPITFSNRKDFPSAYLPHLNPVPDKWPACFCLHRGDKDEWFAEHSLTDYIERIRDWLQDAAAGHLIKTDDNDQFEVTRIIDPIGYNIYESEELKNIAIESRNTGQSFRYIWSEIVSHDLLIDKSSKFSTKSFIIKDDKVIDAAELAAKYNSQTLDKCNIGLLLYANRNVINSVYFTKIPTKYSELIEFCNSLEIDIKSAISTYNEANYRTLQSVPVIIAIERPTLLIGTNSPIELLSFIIDINGYILNGNIMDEAPVFIQEHREPITVEFARSLSNTPYNSDKTAILGAGALGSKIILHLAKSGYNNFDIIDNDTISPHNMIRHGLLSNSIGQNKAIALQNEIGHIFYRDKTNLTIQGNNTSVESFFAKPGNINRYQEIIDATASNNIQMYLSDLIFPNPCRCTRCEIAYNGQLGIIKREGLHRQPRLDDLNIHLIDMSIDNDFISEWLTSRENAPEFEKISIGVGCNSNTMKLSDDIISIHAANFSNIYKFNKQSPSGWLHLLKIAPKGQINSVYISVENYISIKCWNNPKWQCRIKKSLVKEFHNELKQNSPNETGGLLVGRIDIKRKIIYVTRIIIATEDSVKMPCMFTRGVRNMPETINTIRQKTGGLLDYVGEWHTHPNGCAKLSRTDMDAVKQIRNELDRVPYPTFIFLINNTLNAPYIFGPDNILN